MRGVGSGWAEDIGAELLLPPSLCVWPVLRRGLRAPQGRLGLESCNSTVFSLYLHWAKSPCDHILQKLNAAASHFWFMRWLFSEVHNKCFHWYLNCKVPELHGGPLGTKLQKEGGQVHGSSGPCPYSVHVQTPDIFFHKTLMESTSFN